MKKIPASGGPGNNAARFKQRVGILLCVFYAAVYGGFVSISVYDVSLMDTPMPFGLNLAVFYGLGLIVLAFLCALIYSGACAAKSRGFSRVTKRLSEKPAAPEAEGPGA